MSQAQKNFTYTFLTVLIPVLIFSVYQLVHQPPSFAEICGASGCYSSVQQEEISQQYITYLRYSQFTFMVLGVAMLLSGVLLKVKKYIKNILILNGSAVILMSILLAIPFLKQFFFTFGVPRSTTSLLLASGLAVVAILWLIRNLRSLLGKDQS